MERRTKLRLVTILTFCRVPLVLGFLAAALVHACDPTEGRFALAFGLLISAAVTDWLDGYLARRLDVVTDFGAHADPLMDKFFLLSTFPLLVFVAAKDGHTGHAVFLLVLTVLLLGRDQWVTFLRSIGAMCDIAGGAKWSGKLRTGLNFPIMCAVYHFEEAPATLIDPRVLYAFETLALIVNLISLYLYTVHYLPPLRRLAGFGPRTTQES
jgi:CDP-diacylglycerol--glycerol-3-phosphate 3-phosphatidyltransferase